MSDMIERVARTICADYDRLPDTATYYERKASAEQWPSKEDVLHDARCAIEAMREPTDAMMMAEQARVAAMLDRRDDDGRRLVCGGVWRAMIDAALACCTNVSHMPLCAETPEGPKSA